MDSSDINRSTYSTADLDSSWIELSDEDPIFSNDVQENRLIDEDDEMNAFDFLSQSIVPDCEWEVSRQDVSIYDLDTSAEDGFLQGIMDSGLFKSILKPQQEQNNSSNGKLGAFIPSINSQGTHVVGVSTNDGTNIKPFTTDESNRASYNQENQDIPFKDALADAKIREFKDAATPQKHLEAEEAEEAEHQRPFVCVFNFAGCPDAFATKNEWKHHVSAQHMNFTFWLCTTGKCGEVDCNGLNGGVLGRPFRRKDLYTQHLRRMHKGDPAISGEKELQDEAPKQRCELPQYMKCPAQYCHQDFHGPKAWDERMEHVACHLDAVANGAEPPVEFGGPHDETLIEWASSKDAQVIMWRMGRWECC